MASNYKNKTVSTKILRVVTALVPCIYSRWLDMCYWVCDVMLCGLQTVNKSRHISSQ